MAVPPITLAAGAQLYLALYTHKRGTSSALVLSDRDPWQTVPEAVLNGESEDEDEEGQSPEEWLCGAIFHEEYEAGEDETMEFIRVDVPGGLIRLGKFAETD